MNQQIIKGIYELLGTIKEAVTYLSCNENESIRAEIAYSRNQVESLLEVETSCCFCGRFEADKLSNEDWLQEMYRVLDFIECPLQINNSYDKDFLQLISYLWNTDIETMVENMKRHLEVLRQESPVNYKRYVEYFSNFPLWGSFSPEKGDYTTFELRAKILKQRSYEFLWLYKRLEDYLSKRTLYAILLNWVILDANQLRKVRSPFLDYFEPDIFPNNNGDVFVDVGAYIGDSIEQYVSVYGEKYSKIFAYEISEKTCAPLFTNTMRFHDVIIRQKGAGKEKGIMTLIENLDDSANKAEKIDEGIEGKNVEIVTLDDDLENEGVTFIKMDIEGAEQDALLGCKKIIQTRHPKLAICTYHGYEDIWKIPSMIDEMNPKYKFYMRHYGGNLFPTEFVLLCK